MLGLTIGTDTDCKSLSGFICHFDEGEITFITLIM